MASADKYKPQEGDVDDWVAKVQAMAEAVAKGETDTAEILAFLATNPGFAPVGNPTAQSSQYSYISTTTDNALYKITDANPYTSLAGGELFIITFPSANAGAVDIKVDALAQKNLFKDGAALAGGEAEGTHVVQYDLANDRMNMIEGRSNGVTIISIDNTDSPYTVTAADFKSPFLRILVDASAGDVIVKAPTPANYKNKEMIVIADVDPAGNKVETQKSGGTEWHTSYAKGDFIKATSDGTNDIIQGEDVTVYGKLAKTSNENFSGYTTTNPFDTNAAEVTDVGGLMDFVTNFRIDAPFKCLISITYGLIAGSGSIVGRPYVTGSYPFTLVNDISPPDPLFTINLAAPGYIRPDAFNSAGVTRTLYGDAAKDESFFEWRVIKRVR